MAKRITQLTELAAGSVASDDYLAIVDSSAGSTKKVKVSSLVGIPDFGWTAAGETHTYSAWDSTTKVGTITVPSDATTKYTKGMRYRISQTTGGTKYGIIVDVAATSLKVYFGTDYTLNNETITTPFYSIAKVPLGFPASPEKWTRRLTDTAQQTQASPVSGTWYNVGSLSLTVGPGLWRVRARTTYYCPGPNVINCAITLSDTNNSEGLPNLSLNMYMGTTSGGNSGVMQLYFTEYMADLSANKTYYLNARANVASIGSLTFYGTTGLGGANIIEAVCAYL